MTFAKGDSMKNVGIALALILIGSVAGYGYHAHREVARIEAPAPGFYEHFAMIQVKARMRHGRLAANVERPALPKPNAAQNQAIP